MVQVISYHCGIVERPHRCMVREPQLISTYAEQPTHSPSPLRPTKFANTIVAQDDKLRDITFQLAGKPVPNLNCSQRVDA